MYNLKHTPGPWSYGYMDKDKRISIDSPITGYRVADAYKETNARLMAAAPEMLEALIARCKNLNDLGGDNMSLSNELEYTYLSNIIKKATGTNIEEVLDV